MNPQAIIPLLLIVITPCIQVILLALKVKGRINPPPGVIAILAFLLGVGLPILSMNIVESSIHANPSGPKCGVIPVSFLFAGFFITLVATPLIELIFCVVLNLKKKRLTAN
jgi:RsiW-degrading membrane proteinase PrsW (M82 family)